MSSLFSYVRFEILLFNVIRWLARHKLSIRYTLESNNWEDICLVGFNVIVLVPEGFSNTRNTCNTIFGTTNGESWDFVIDLCCAEAVDFSLISSKE